jgi:hypothetical protein
LRPQRTELGIGIIDVGEFRGEIARHSRKSSGSAAKEFVCDNRCADRAGIVA